MTTYSQPTGFVCSHVYGLEHIVIVPLCAVTSAPTASSLAGHARAEHHFANVLDAFSSHGPFFPRLLLHSPAPPLGVISSILFTNDNRVLYF